MGENTARDLKSYDERWFRTVFEHAATGIAITDLDGAFEQCNPAYCALLGYTEDELRRVAFQALVHPEDREANLAELRHLLAGEVPHFEVENRYVHKSGRPVSVRKWVSLLPDETGRPTHIMALVTDVTEHKRAEQALRESQAHFQLIADRAPVMLWMCGSDKLCTWVSRPWLEFVGRTLEQEVGHGWTENIHAEDLDRCLQTFHAAFNGRQSFSMEYRMRRRDGEYRWLLDNGIPLVLNGAFQGYLGSCVDISERKQAEQAGRESEDRLQLMADALPALIAYIGADGRYQFNNAAYEHWFGRPSAAYRGRHMREVLGEEAYAVLAEHVEAALAGEPRSFEARVPYEGAGPRNVLVHYVPHRDPGRRVLGFFALIIDLTERRQAEEAVRRSEELQQAVLASLTSHIAVLGRDGRIVRVNPAWEEFARENGGDADRCGVGADYLAVCRAAGAESRRVVDGIQAVLNGIAADFSVEYPCPFGARQHWFLMQVTPLRTAEGGVVVSHMNITDRVQAEQDVRDREARLRAILDTAADAIITIDGEGTIQSVNPAAERMFGYTAAEMTGRNVCLLMPSPFREEHDRYLADYLRSRVSQVIGIGREVEAVRKDSTLFPVELSVSEVDHLPLFTGILHDLTRRKELEREVVEIVSLEQRRIGQDLHDTVAQELTALNLLVDDLGDALRADPAGAAALIGRMAGGLRRSQQQLRAVLRGLVPVAVDAAGLMAALGDLADRTNQEGGPACSFDCPEAISVADNVVATQLYLIAQEAVRNAVKHARPRAVRITLESNGHLALRVRDDGVGMPAQPTESQGLGLRIMRNRAAIIGAALTIGPGEPAGTLVTCVLTRRPDEQHPDR